MRAFSVYGNPVPASSQRRAHALFRRYARRFGFDPERKPELGSLPVQGAAEEFGIRLVVPATDETCGERSRTTTPLPAALDPAKDLVIGTIRMGYGHYRIALAIASAARAAGMTPWWFDFKAFPDSAASKTIVWLERLYARFSRLSQKSPLFNRYVWEKITSEYPRRLTYCARDNELSRLFTPLLGNLPREAAYIATHPWTARAAVADGRFVVNAVPDNYPLAFHVVEGAIHAIQSPSAHFGYRSLHGMAVQGEAQPMPAMAARFVGHFVDHEIVANIEEDCARRAMRIRDRKPKRLLLTIGGSGAQLARFLAILRSVRSAIEEGRLAVFVNMGDHTGLWTELRNSLDAEGIAWNLHGAWSDTAGFAAEAASRDIHGLHVFVSDAIFPAVYATNLLLRVSDLMITKPSELSFYPVPKLFIQRVGRHEAWGAIRGAEIGDGTLETDSEAAIIRTLKFILDDEDLLRLYCDRIVMNRAAGLYDGAYEAVRIAREYAMKPPIQ